MQLIVKKMLCLLNLTSGLIVMEHLNFFSTKRLPRSLVSLSIPFQSLPHMHAGLACFEKYIIFDMCL